MATLQGLSRAIDRAAGAYIGHCRRMDAWERRRRRQRRHRQHRRVLLAHRAARSLGL